MNSHMQVETWNFKRHPMCNFTIPEELEFVERYKNGETFSDMAEEACVSRGSLWKLVTNIYDVKPYQTRGYPGVYDIDTKALNKIDDEESAYALGLLATDGHALKDRNQLEFDSTDQEQVENLKQCLQCTQEAYIKQPRTTTIRGEVVKGKKELYVLRFGPKEIYDGFLRFFAGRKYNRNEIPESIKQNSYVNHFIRGFMGGDGCVSDNILTFTGHKGLLEDVQDILIKNCDIGRTKLQPKQNNDITYNLQVTGKKQLARVYQWLYNDATYYLTRKKDSFEQLVKYCTPQ